MNKIEIARGALRLRDDEAFKHLISEIEAGLTKTFLDASSTEKQLAEARETVRGLAAIKRELVAQSDPLKTADSKKGQHRASD
jgi:hypothetical protein